MIGQEALASRFVSMRAGDTGTVIDGRNGKGLKSRSSSRGLPTGGLVFHLPFLLLERPRMNTVPVAVASKGSVSACFEVVDNLVCPSGKSSKIGRVPA
jgi:hypothetical protein